MLGIDKSESCKRRFAKDDNAPCVYRGTGLIAVCYISDLLVISSEEDKIEHLKLKLKGLDIKRLEEAKVIFGYRNGLELRWRILTPEESQLEVGWRKADGELQVNLNPDFSKLQKKQ